MNKKEYIEKFERFGLSKVEAEIYLALNGSYPKTVNEISNEINIPRSTIYDSIEKLKDKALVGVIVEQNTTRFNAYPVELLGSIIEDKRSELDELEFNLTELKKDLNPFTAANLGTQVRFYNGEKGIRQLMWNILESDGEMCGYSTYGRRNFVSKNFYDRFVKVYNTKILKDRVIIKPYPETIEYIKKNVGQEWHQNKPDDIRYINNDDFFISGDICIYNNVYAAIYWNNNQLTGFEIENAEFVKTQKAIFNEIWKIAKPISQIIR